MGPFRSAGPRSIWFDQGGKANEIDSLLAGAGYVVRSSDLQDVAQRLETLESTMVNDHQPFPVNDGQVFRWPDYFVHNNPSDITGWVDSMLSQISPSLPSNTNFPSGSSNTPTTTKTDCAIQWQPARRTNQSPVPSVVCLPQPTTTTQIDEDSGIQLVHLLMACAESVQRGDNNTAVAVIEEMRSILLSRNVNASFGIGKVAGYFVDALSRRIYASTSATASDSISTVESDILYHSFYEACPYLKFSHFTANQAILESFDGHDRVHVIDCSLMHGLQWPALIQALALRPGGPPFLRITGIGPPSSDGRDSLRDIGLRLAELARSLGVRFAFRGVAANRLDDIKPWMVQVADGQPSDEVVAVNSIMQLHRLLSDDDRSINSVLDWILGLRPKIVTLIEQEVDLNKVNFIDRFTEALFYYSTMFDSLDAGGGISINLVGKNEQNALAEMYLQREICNVLCCEGSARTERHEPLAKWKARMSRAGFEMCHLGSNAFKQASMLLTLFSGGGHSVDEVEGCLTLGWHSRPMISASAWRVNDGFLAVQHVATEKSLVSKDAGVGNGNYCDDISGSSSGNNGNNFRQSSNNDNDTIVSGNHHYPLTR